MGNVPLTATATGTITGVSNGRTTVTLSINGSASLPTGACAVSLTGNGEIVDETLTIDFTGTSCLGPFSGHETLRRSDLFPPPPAPAPTPEPPPPSPTPEPPPPAPTQEPWELCAAFINDKLNLVECVHEALPPNGSGAAAFEITKRVAWLLRGEGAGLLIKTGGENIISWMGYSFSLSRICYPDGHIFKVITDAGDGGVNGPGWADNGFVDPSLYVPAIKP
jgi:hypothetical protein